MFIQISHTRIGKLDLHSVYEEDQPKGPLPLLACYHARHFQGKIYTTVYGTQDSPLMLVDFSFKPEVTLTVTHGEDTQKLLLVVEGSLVLEYNGGDPVYLEKKMLAIFCGPHYNLQIPESTKVRYYVLDIAALTKKLSLNNQENGSYHSGISTKAPLDDIMNPPRTIEQPEYWLSNRLSQLILSLEGSIPLTKAKAGRHKNKSEYAVAAAKIIRNNPDKKYTTSELSKSVHLNECGLKKAFRKENNDTIASLQRKQRAEIAIELMLHTDKIFTEIWMECGYATEETFRNNIKKITGYSPRNFKKKYKL